MSTMADKESLATLLSLTNVLTGRLGEVLLEDSLVQIAVVSDKDLVTAKVLVSQQVEYDSQAVQDTPLATVPIFPDHEIVEFRAAVGDRLTLGFTNGNAATATIRWIVKITPLAA